MPLSPPSGGCPRACHCSSSRGLRSPRPAKPGWPSTQVHAVQSALADPRIFGQAIHSPDPEAAIPASDLLTGLRGKDVLIVFVESYGQVAVQGTSFSPGIDAVLRQQQGMLASAGWSTESAWAGSPTSGGVSWLAHSTLQSGLWVNSQQRYDELIASQRFTLSDAFNKAGWHTVLDDPEDTPWATAKSFYHYAQVYNRSNVGYHGPSFSYSAMPDQYTYAEFQRLELTPGHQPVMAQIATTSSHTPWVPLPSMVPWNQVGNGSIFNAQRGTAADVARVWSNTNTVRQYFGQSIQYSMTALTSWVTELNDPNLVLILLGDEQPHSTVSGPRSQQLRADLDHHPRPFGAQADVLLALAERAAAQSLRSVRGNGRLPQPVPQHLQHGPGPGDVRARESRQVAGVVDAMDGGKSAAVPLDLVDAGGAEI